MPLSPTLTLPGGHKVSGKQNLLASFSQKLLLIRMKFITVFDQFKLNVPILFLSEIKKKKK